MQQGDDHLCDTGADDDAEQHRVPARPLDRTQVVASEMGQCVYVLRKAAPVDTVEVCEMIAKNLYVRETKSRWVSCFLRVAVDVLRSEENGGFEESESLGHLLKVLQVQRVHRFHHLFRRKWFSAHTAEGTHESCFQAILIHHP